jgi:hypothetical protein
LHHPIEGISLLSLGMFPVYVQAITQIQSMVSCQWQSTRHPFSADRNCTQSAVNSDSDSAHTITKLTDDLMISAHE